jgi:hypothetical protein
MFHQARRISAKQDVASKVIVAHTFLALNCAEEKSCGRDDAERSTSSFRVVHTPSLVLSSVINLHKQPMFAVRRGVVRKELHTVLSPTRTASRRTFRSTSKMESTSTSAALFATVSTSSTRGAEPEGTKDLQHHQKDGKGFRNPWPSYVDFTPASIMGAMISYASHVHQDKHQRMLN